MGLTQTQINDHFRYEYFFEVDGSENALNFVREQWGKFREECGVSFDVLRALKSDDFRSALDDYIDYHYQDIYDVAERKPTAIEIQQEVIRQVESDFSSYCEPIFAGEYDWRKEGLLTKSGRFKKVPLTNLVETIFLEITGLQETSCFWFESVEDFWECVSQEIFCGFFYYCVIQLFKNEGINIVPTLKE